MQDSSWPAGKSGLFRCFRDFAGWFASTESRTKYINFSLLLIYLYVWTVIARCSPPGTCPGATVVGRDGINKRKYHWKYHIADLALRECRIFNSSLLPRFLNSHDIQMSLSQSFEAPKQWDTPKPRMPLRCKIETSRWRETETLKHHSIKRTKRRDAGYSPLTIWS